MGVDAIRIQFQNILNKLFPVYKAVPTNETCRHDRRRHYRILVECHFHYKPRGQMIPRAHSLARTNIYVYVYCPAKQRVARGRVK
jgi:c-di-GMP-binding flagellar brake protein YcgR